MIRRFSFLLCLTLAFASGCNVHWFPDNPNDKKGGDPSPAVSAVSDAAAGAVRTRASMQADVAREVAEFIRTKHPKEFSDIEAFESPKNMALISDEVRTRIYQKLRDAQDARFGREKNSDNLDLIRDADGTPDWEATAKIYDETAEGFEQAANAGGKK